MKVWYNNLKAMTINSLHSYVDYVSTKWFLHQALRRPRVDIILLCLKLLLAVDKKKKEKVNGTVVVN